MNIQEEVHWDILNILHWWFKECVQVGLCFSTRRSISLSLTSSLVVQSLLLLTFKAASTLHFPFEYDVMFASDTSGSCRSVEVDKPATPSWTLDSSRPAAPCFKEFFYRRCLLQLLASFLFPLLTWHVAFFFFPLSSSLLPAWCEIGTCRESTRKIKSKARRGRGSESGNE